MECFTNGGCIGESLCPEKRETFFGGGFFGHASPVYSTPGSPIRQMLQGIEKEEILSGFGGLER